MFPRRKQTKSLARTRGALTPSQVLALVVAALVAVALCVIPLGRSYWADAYTPDTIDPAAGPGAEAVHGAEVSHSQVGSGSEAHDPRPGESFTYTYKFYLDDIPWEPSVDTKTVLRLNADAYARFTNTQNPRIAGQPRNLLDISELKCQDNLTCTAVLDTSKVRPGKNAWVSIQLPAKVSEDAPPGSVIFGSGSVSSTYTPSGKLNAGTPRYFDPDPGQPCQGTFNFEWELVDGAWLGEIKFADAAGEGKLEINSDPLSATNRDSFIQVLAPDTRAPGRYKNITAQVLQHMQYNPEDPERPFLGERDPIVVANPNAKWLQSANWPLDVTTYTGKTWLPAGTKVKVAKHGRHKACAAGFAVDFDKDRPFAAALSTGRPVTTPSASANTSWVIPGEPPKILSCQDKIWFSEEEFSSNGLIDSSDKGIGYYTDYDTWRPKATFVSRTKTVNGRYGHVATVALHQSTPSRVYYVAYKKGGIEASGLRYRDLDKRENDPEAFGTIDPGNGSIPGDGPKWGKGAPGQRMNIGFDKDGLLWLLQNKQEGLGSISAIYVIDPTAPHPRWTKVGQVLSKSGKGDIFDIVFDKDGNMYGLGVGGAQGFSKNGYLAKLDGQVLRRALRGGSPARFGFLGGDDYDVRNFGSGDKFVGLAWGADGNLYASQQYAGLWRIPLSDWSSPQAFDRISATFISNSQIQKGPNVSRKYIAGDLGSCNYGEIAQVPQKPKYLLNKAVIDPVTQAIVKAGQNSPHPAPLADDNTVVADYVVTLTNAGNAAGNPGAVLDRPNVPRGFSVTKVTVLDLDGTNPRERTLEADGTLNLYGAGTLAPNETKIWRVRITSKFTDYKQVNWTQAGVCSDDAEGSYGGGFMNTVSMEGDADGAENNHACVPTVPRGTGKITLIKDIVDRKGNQLPARATDSVYFTLSAKQPGGEKAAVKGASGTSPTSGQPAVDHQEVEAGIYQLDEKSNNQAKTSGYRFGTWQCSHENGQQLPLGPADTIAVSNGDDITCRVSNSPDNPVHVLKRAEKPASNSNVHIGAPAVPDEDGVYRMRYVIDVVNESDDAVDTGKLVEHFTVPEGMKWAPNFWSVITLTDKSAGSAQVDMSSALRGSGCRYVYGGDAQYGWCYEEQFKRNPTLATSIKNLPPHSTISFQVEVPLQIDSSNAGPTSKYELHAAQLEKCVAATSASGKPFAKPGFGIINTVTLEGEDENYSDIHTEDNRACIPVRVPLAPPPPLPLTGGNSALAFYLFGLPALGLGLVGAVAYRLRKAGRHH